MKDLDQDELDEFIKDFWDQFPISQYVRVNGPTLAKILTEMQYR